MVVAVNSIVDIDNCGILSGNTNGISSSANARVLVEDWDAQSTANYLTGTALTAIGGGQIHVKTDGLPFTTNSDPINEYDGGLITWQVGEAHTQTGTTYTYTVLNATDFQNIKQFIEGWGKHIPYGTTFRVELNGTFNANSDFIIQGFSGGGT